jgi:hypothetical protein
VDCTIPLWDPATNRTCELEAQPMLPRDVADTNGYILAVQHAVCLRIPAPVISATSSCRRPSTTRCS